MPVYKDTKVKKNPWYYHLDIKDENGKRKLIKKRGFKTKSAAQEALVEVQSLYNKGTFIQEKNITYKDFLQQYIESKKTKVKNSTLKTYTWLIDHHIVPNLGMNELNKLNPVMIQRYYNKLTSGKILSSENIQKIHTLIKDSLNKAVRWELISRNVGTMVDRPKSEKKHREVWTLEDCHKFLDHAIDSRYYAAFLLAITTGMRQGEILGLRWKDIDFDKGLIRVVQTLSHDGKELTPGAKTKTSVRNITVGLETLNKLKKQKGRVIKERWDLGQDYNNHDLVICTRFGTPLIPRNLNRSYYVILNKLDLKHITFHDLRHTHCSILLDDDNPNIKAISERMGHSSTRITMDTYAHLMPNTQQKVASRFEDNFYKKSQANNEISKVVSDK